MRWRPIVGWEALYEVSDTGAVRSLDREIFVPGPNGEIGRRRYKGRVLRLNRLKSGYCMISMTAPERKRRCAYVHDLVTEARSEEHTSELQSLMRISYAVFCLQKKNTQSTNYTKIA